MNGLDHLAIVVPNTEEALKIWRDKFGLPVDKDLRDEFSRPESCFYVLTNSRA